MRLAQMLKLYATATDGMSIPRIAAEIDVPAQQLQDWLAGNDQALCAREFARLQCWCFMRTPVREVVHEPLPQDSVGGHCD
jgi:methylglyoxal synthase